ncbi:MAG: alginate lyase family protein [Phycisphaeraceae bacterium]|nr:alginate lyase family protein [Phycisphaeraceae bacterium]
MALATDDPPITIEAFRHPGLLHSNEELAYIRARIQSGDKPWAGEWEKLDDWCKQLLELDPEPRRKVVRGPSNRPDKGGTELQRDASAAYSLATAWCLSGNKAYAKKAVGFLDAWSAKLEKLEGHDTKLLSGMAGVKLVNAGELIRHSYDGWKGAGQDRFEVMLRNVFYEPIKDFYPTANGNWDAAMIQTMLGMGIFLDDRKMFDRAVTYYRQGEGNGAITNYFNAFGQCQESGRDQAHTQMGLGFLGVACEMAWKQGVDLYSEADNRLALGFEYTAKYNLGHDVPYEPYTSVQGRYKYKRISDDSRGRFAPIYERAVYHYHYRKGLEMPFTREAAAKPPRPRGIRRGWAHFRWTDLMFERPPGDA